jgi:hypothetical protein
METLLLTVMKSPIEQLLDKRANDRVLNELPQHPKLSNDTLAPNLEDPKIEADEPSLLYARRDSEDPIAIKSQRLALDANLTAANTDVTLPTWQKLRTLNALPKLQKFRADTAEPNLPPPLTLKLEPIEAKLNTLQADEHLENDLIENVEPNCANDRIETAEPMRARPITVR